MTISTEQAAPEVPEDPEALVYMHHPETRGVKAIKRRQFVLYEKRGWALGDGGIYADIDEVPGTASPIVHRDREGALVTPYAEAPADAPVEVVDAPVQAQAPAAPAVAPVTATAPKTEAPAAPAATVKK